MELHPDLLGVLHLRDGREIERHGRAYRVTSAPYPRPHAEVVFRSGGGATVRLELESATSRFLRRPLVRTTVFLDGVVYDDPFTDTRQVAPHKLRVLIEQAFLDLADEGVRIADARRERAEHERRRRLDSLQESMRRL